MCGDEKFASDVMCMDVDCVTDVFSQEAVQHVDAMRCLCVRFSLSHLQHSHGPAFAALNAAADEGY